MIIGRFDSSNDMTINDINIDSNDSDSSNEF